MATTSFLGLLRESQVSAALFFKLFCIKSTCHTFDEKKNITIFIIFFFDMNFFLGKENNQTKHLKNNIQIHTLYVEQTFLIILCKVNDFDFLIFVALEGMRSDFG